MEESNRRHQRTLDEWASGAIRSMLRSSDPIAVYDQQDNVIKDRVKTRLSQYRRATMRSLVPVALLTVAAVIVFPAPIVFLPLAGVALIVALTLKQDRLGRLKDAVFRFDPPPHETAASTETRPDGHHVTHAQRQYSRVGILDAQRQLATLDHLVGRAVWVALMATFLAAVLLMLLRTVDFIPASAVTVALIWAATISLAVYRHRVAMVAKSSPYSHRSS